MQHAPVAVHSRSVGRLCTWWHGVQQLLLCKRCSIVGPAMHGMVRRQASCSTTSWRRGGWWRTTPTLAQVLQHCGVENCVWDGTQAGELFDYIVEKGRLVEDDAYFGASAAALWG